MSWYLHAVEQADEQWVCQHGRRIYDTHRVLEEAIEHLREIGAELEGAVEMFAHFRSGRVEPVVR